ncbi:MAG: CRISPR-associated primase-polymerase type B [Bacteroidia bacterium]|nr:CRISPR-associated primase-polymerase type B [Bacteroidia bacterium]
MLYSATGFAAGQQMDPVSAEALHARICDPRSGLADQVALLRKVRQLDPDAYRRAKTQLPWFIGAQFAGARRKIDQFVQLDCFVVDLDHCRESEAAFQALRSRIQADPQVLLCFVSPGGDGLKCLFRLSQPLTHTKLYSDFYRSFALDFAARHGAAQAVDLRTCDVTRVCFLSSDPEAFLRPDPEPVDWGIVQELNLLPDPLPFDPDPGPGPPPAAERGSLPADVYAEIRKRLQPGKPQRPLRPVVVPDALERIVEPVRQACAAAGIALAEIRDIQYGKKLVFQFRDAWAELNVFHGKSGFSIVKSLKRGSDPDLCDLLHALVSEVVFRPAPLEDLKARIMNLGPHDN